MRRAAKVDANQKTIKQAFERLGCTVQLLHQVGGGCPDMVVAKRGINVMVEIKDGDKPKSARKLTADQIDWHRDWKGWRAIIESEWDCSILVGAIERTGQILIDSVTLSQGKS